jgi:hypothetical protein
LSAAISPAWSAVCVVERASTAATVLSRPKKLSFDFDYERSLALFEAARDSEDALAALHDLLRFLFGGLKEAAALGAGRVNVQGWGEALVNPPLLETVRRVLGIYRDITTQIIRRAQATGQIDAALDPAAFANTLISLYYGLEMQLALDPALDVDAYAAAVSTLLKPAAQPARASAGAGRG